MKKIREEMTIENNTYAATKIQGIEVFMHEMIMEDVLGRKLRANEIVLHLNDDTLDNQEKNLLLGIVEQNVDDVNVCCPYLNIGSCSDTDEHKHLVCEISSEIIGNTTIKEICLEEFKNCKNRKKIMLPLEP